MKKSEGKIVETESTPGTVIAEYSPTEAALAEFRKKYQGVAYPVSTTQGYRDAIAARAEIRDVRVKLEKERKKLKEPALERCRMIDAEAKRITAELEALEVPIDQQIKAEDARKEEIRQAKIEEERKRVEAIQAKIDVFRNATAAMTGKPSADISAAIQFYTDRQVGDEYQELQAVATEAKDAALSALNDLLLATQAHEAEQAKIAAERAELARLREEAAKREAEAEAKRLEEEAKARVAREAEEKALAAKRAEEQAKIDAERKAEEERQRLEREAHEAKMKAEREEADRKRREAEVEQAEIDRQKAELERQRIEQEKQARLLSERRALLAQNKRDNPTTALVDILALAENVAEFPDHQYVRAQIAIIAEASIPETKTRGKKAA